MNTDHPVRRPAFLNHLPEFCACLLIALYSYAAASKLMAFDLFRGQLLNQSFPKELAGPLAYLLPPAELLVAGLLAFPRSRYTGFLLSFLLLFFFSGYIALVLLGYWERVPCSCGGILSHLGWGSHLVFNLFFLLLNLAAILLDRPPAQHTRYHPAP